MQTTPITMERSEAKALYEKYIGALHFGEKIDREIARAYRLLSQGKLIIKALESIKAAGLDDDGLPKLAITRATNSRCFVRVHRDGACEFKRKQWEGAESEIVRFPSGSFAPPYETFPINRWSRDGARDHEHDAEAIVPIIPAHLRPKHALSNYHILWEADWRDVPVDPYLIQRIGKSDMWLVVAMWDLTPVERAALQARI